jgi:hypothetical protein
VRAGLGQKKQKPTCGGSVLASKVRAGSFLGREDLIRAGYTGIEMKGGRNRVRREGGLVWAKRPKTEPWRLGFG